MRRNLKNGRIRITCRNLSHNIRCREIFSQRDSRILPTIIILISLGIIGLSCIPEKSESKNIYTYLPIAYQKIVISFSQRDFFFAIVKFWVNLRRKLHI